MPGTHIVVVDDDPAALAAVSALLGAYGHHVAAFDSAEAFLDAEIKLESVSLLLLDVRLPGMSGRDLLNKLMTGRIQRPVILISGFVEPELSAAAMQDGAVAVLEKPIEPLELVESIQRAIQDHDMQRARSHGGSLA